MKAIAALLVLGAGCAAGDDVDDLSDHDEAAVTVDSAAVVNECRVGPAGYLELYNPSPVPLDLYRDPSSCWWIDDASGGASPRLLTDSNVKHAAGSTTCASAGRAATCGIVGPEERVWISYAGFNTGSADRCRLLRSDWTGSTCGTTTADVGVGGATAANGDYECFGRTPDGGTWQSAVIACTPGGASNGGAPSCTPGTACDDGNACTTGEYWTTQCTCSPGVMSCDDGDACTADACTTTGCTHAPVADPTCGNHPPALVINEVLPGTGGWFEIYNPTPSAVDVGGWQVDDVASGGGSPRTIAAGSVIQAYGLVVVSYSYVNTASIDQVRLLAPTGEVVDSHDNFYAGVSLAGKCFGRHPDGDAWSAPIPCTQGTSN